jgi:hypothetical protein
VKFTSFNKRHRAIRRGRFVIDIDWAAFFDQFLMDPSVRPFFAFKSVDGRVMQMRVTGLKHSVSIAQFATLQLLNFQWTCYLEAYIDHVRVVGMTAKSSQTRPPCCADARRRVRLAKCYG